MKYKAYVCSKDAIYHMGSDYDGVTVYFSEKSLREHSKCISDEKYGCTVCEIELEVPDAIVEN